jgi:hypothetical protein
MLKLIPIKGVILAVLTAGALCYHVGQAQSETQKTYVGSDACRSCHEAEYDRFNAYAKKAHSYEHILKLRKGITEAEFRQCLACHTTGYGKPGGFRSEQETPQLKEPGCEVCHGPGSIHASSQDPKDIDSKVSIKDCEACHRPDRVEAFGYRPVIFGGAH